MNCYALAHTHFWQTTSRKKVKNVHALYPEAVDWKLEYKLPFV